MALLQVGQKGAESCSNSVLLTPLFPSPSSVGFVVVGEGGTWCPGTSPAANIHSSVSGLTDRSR